MTTESNKSGGWRFPILQGVLPIKASQIPAEVIAGLTLAALAIPEVMGYTKISGTPVITGLYTILIPMALFALFGSSRHLVVGADSATAAILAAGLVGIASVGSDEYVALAAVLAFMAAGFLILARIIGLGFLADFLSRTVLVGLPDRGRRAGRARADLRHAWPEGWRARHPGQDLDRSSADRRGQFLRAGHCDRGAGGHRRLEAGSRRRSPGR